MKKSLIGRRFTVGSTNPACKLNPGHLSGIIPLDRQDLCRSYQHSLIEQISDCLYNLYENLSLQNNWVLLLIKSHIQVILPCNDSLEMYQMLIRWKHDKSYFSMVPYTSLYMYIYMSVSCSSAAILLFPRWP